MEHSPHHGVIFVNKSAPVRITNGVLLSSIMKRGKLSKLLGYQVTCLPPTAVIELDSTGLNRGTCLVFFSPLGIGHYRKHRGNN